MKILANIKQHLGMDLRRILHMMIGFHKVNGLINEIDKEQELKTVIRVQDSKLEDISNQTFQEQEYLEWKHERKN